MQQAKHNLPDPPEDPKVAYPPWRWIHWLFAGFTQKRSRRSNGVRTLFEIIAREWAGPQTLVEYYPWIVDPGELAALAAEINADSLHQTGQPVNIQLVGYSFGGQTAVQLAQALAGTGAEVDSLILCDPVRRRGRLGWLAAANPWATLSVPSTVRELRVLRQRNPRWQLAPPFFWPAGHEVKSAGSVKRTPDIALTGTATHLTIDNHGRFQDFVLDAADRLHARPRAVPARARADRDLAGGNWLGRAA